MTIYYCILHNKEEGGEEEYVYCENDKTKVWEEQEYDKAEATLLKLRASDEHPSYGLYALVVIPEELL